MSTHEDRDVGNGVLHTLSNRGDILTCHTINGFCTGCGKPLVSAEDQHDGPSGTGALDVISQGEMDRIERVKFDMGGGWEGFESRHGDLRRGG